MSSNASSTVKVQQVGECSDEETTDEAVGPVPKFDKMLKPNHHANHFVRKKRYHSSSFSHSGVNGLTIDGAPSDLGSLSAMLRRVQLSDARLPFGKNSKKSRNGRKVPSKRGGKNHENFTDVLDEIDLDPKDPDYDSDAAPVIFDELRVMLPDEAFDKMVHCAMRDFFEHGNTQDVIDELSDANISPHQLRRLPFLAIMQAIQHRHSHCELTSELLSDMCGKILTPAHIQQGFQLLLSEINDLTIDVPKAPEYIGRFIARAVADDILPPKFIESQRSALSHFVMANNSHPGESDSFETGHDVQACTNTQSPNTVSRSGVRNLSDSSVGAITIPDTTSSGISSASSLTNTAMVSDLAKEALSKAETYLILRHAFARLNNIWGVPTGPEATKILKKSIRRLLYAYMESGDADNAIETLQELDSPHFHHELVFQVIIMTIERSTEGALEGAINLLREMCKSSVVTLDQLMIGIRRVHAELPDLQLDVPNAYSLMARFTSTAAKAGFLPKELTEDIPSKQRRRFISETHSTSKTGHFW